MSKFFLFVLNLCIVTFAKGSTFTSFTEAEKKMIAARTMAGLAEADKKAFEAKYIEACDLTDKALFAYGIAFESDCDAAPAHVALIDQDFYIYISDKKRGFKNRLHVYNLKTKKMAWVVDS